MKRKIYSIRRHEDKEGPNQLITARGRERIITRGEEVIGPLISITHSDPEEFYRSRQTALGWLIGHLGNVTPEQVGSSYLAGNMEPVEAYFKNHPLLKKSDLLNVWDPAYYPEELTERDDIFDYWLSHDYRVDDKPGVMLLNGANIIKLIVSGSLGISAEGVEGIVGHASNVDSCLIALLDNGAPWNVPSMRMADIGGSIRAGEAYQLVVDYRSDIRCSTKEDPQPRIATMQVQYRGETKPISEDKIYALTSMVQ